MLHTLPVRGRRSRLVWPRKIHRRKSDLRQFFIIMDNMYIKSKLRIFWIHIWHEKVSFVMKNLMKIRFFMISPHFRWDFFFRNSNFSENFIYTPQFFFHPRVQKMINYNYTKFDTPNFITDKVTSISKRDGCDTPPPTFLRVKPLEQLKIFLWLANIFCATFQPFTWIWLCFSQISSKFFP